MDHWPGTAEFHLKPTRASRAEKQLRWFADYWDALAVLLLMLAAVPTVWLSSQTLVRVGEPNVMDDSWILDTIFKASRGLWLGRHVAFTYGPLYQWLSSLPTRWGHLSLGNAYATWRVVPLYLGLVLAFATLRLLLPEQPSWKRAVLLLLLIVFWAPADLRPFIAVFLFAAFVRSWHRAEEERLQPAVLGFASGLFCTAAFLYSADTGVYAVAALLISLAATTLEKPWADRALRRFVFALLCFTSTSVALVIAINCWMAGPLDFRFWKTSLAIVDGYRWIEPSMMLRSGKTHLVATLIIGALVFLLRAVTVRDRTSAVTARPGFLVGAFSFAFLLMQSGLVRSDDYHVLIADFGMTFFAGAVIFAFASHKAVSTLAMLLAVLSSWMLATPDSVWWPTSIRARYSLIAEPLTQCPQGTSNLDRACLTTAYKDLFQTTNAYVQLHSGREDFLLVFPYQTIFGFATNRNTAGGIMQGYLASGPYLSQIEIDGLRRASAPVGLYFPDDPDLSMPIDGISNFTRSPEVWLWIVRHYRSDQNVAPAIVGLVRDDTRASRLAEQPRSLNLPARTYPIVKRSSLLDLGSVTWPADGADFLRLRLTVRYSFGWKLRKPQRMLLEITRADGNHDLRSFALPPNVSSEIWIYPWNEADLARYFASAESDWRTSARPAITHLQLWVTPVDWVSKVPDSVTIEAADAIRLSLSPN